MKHSNIILVIGILSVSSLNLVGAKIRDLQGFNFNSTDIEYTVPPSRGSAPVPRRYLRKRKPNIFGPDDRRGFKDASWPWRAVGRIDTGHKMCTGTLVGPRLLLTAQHCLNIGYDGSLGWLKFTPAYHDGEAPYGSAYGKHESTVSGIISRKSSLSNVV